MILSQNSQLWQLCAIGYLVRISDIGRQVIVLPRLAPRPFRQHLCVRTPVVTKTILSAALAKSRRVGRRELAHGSTAFGLDKIAAAPG
jgi:hypothetical protein